MRTAAAECCQPPAVDIFTSCIAAAAVIFNLVVGFDLRLCAGLSHAVVAVGALGAVLYGLLQPSPSNPRTTLLNFDLAMVGAVQ